MNKDNLLESGAFDFLKTDATMRQSGLNVSGDLAISSRPHSYVQEIRDVLAQTARRIDQLGKTYLSACTPEQFSLILEQHAHIGFNNPLHGLKTASMTCTGISQNDRGKWVLHFGTKKFPVHDLDIQEVLGFLQTVENVLYGHATVRENTVKENKLA